MPKLDRLIEFDERSKAFPIRTLVEGKARRSYTWSVGVSLNQGNEGACVGFGWTHERAARPKVDLTVTDQTAFNLYYRAQHLDVWPGENYEGTSVIAGAKAAIEAGWISEYRWALGPGAEAAENDLALAVGYKGPAVLGTYWYASMDYPVLDAAGRRWVNVNPSSGIRGGHCYLTHGYSVKLDAYKCWNSWGAPSEFWIKRTDMITLLADEGEACIPVKRN